MSKLQQLLNEKWPIQGLPANSYNHHHAMREAFTEGYNAAVEEFREYLQYVSRLESSADSCVGVVDYPHTKALRQASSKARELLSRPKDNK